MCDVTRDLQTPPLLQTATSSQTPPSHGAWSTLCTGVKLIHSFILNIYNVPFSDSEALPT